MCELEMHVRKARLRWAGHVCRMQDSRLPKKVLFGELVEGRARPGRLKKTWLGCLREDLERTGIVYDQWTQKAKDLSLWLKLISSLTPVKEK